MNEFMTALIGLGGVVVGSLISFMAERYRDVETRIREIREESARLAGAATSYSATMAQFVRDVIDDKQKLREASDLAEVKDYLRDQDYWERVTGSLFDYFNSTFESSLTLTTTNDRRIAQQATVLRLTVIDAHNQISVVLTHEGDVTDTQVEELRTKINTEAEILLGMVRPRDREALRRFRDREVVLEEYELEHRKRTAADDSM